MVSNLEKSMMKSSKTNTEKKSSSADTCINHNHGIDKYGPTGRLNLNQKDFKKLSKEQQAREIKYEIVRNYRPIEIVRK